MNGPLFLKLSQHMYDNIGGVILGLSIDEHPSQAANDVVGKSTSQPGESETSKMVTISAIENEVVGLKVVDQSAAGQAQTAVVITIDGAKDQADPANPLAVDITLTQNSELKIKCLGDRMSVVPLTPALARHARGDIDRCRALIADGKPCRLAKINHQWCFFHQEHKALLHDVELWHRKPWYESVQQYQFMRGNNIETFNTIQESLALRILITETLYAGDEDPNHEAFVITTLRNRSNLLTQLRTNKSDGEGRVSIQSCFAPFLALARAAETNPTSRDGWRRELTVNVEDVDLAVNRLGYGATPSLFDFLLPLGGDDTPDDGTPDDSTPDNTSSPSAMHDTIAARAEWLGDLPPIVREQDRPAKNYEDMTVEEQRAYCDWRGYAWQSTEDYLERRRRSAAGEWITLFDDYPDWRTMKAEDMTVEEQQKFCRLKGFEWKGTEEFFEQKARWDSWQADDWGAGSSVGLCEAWLFKLRRLFCCYACR